MSPIALATEQYDDWLKQQLEHLAVEVDQAALDEKHRQMAKDPFRLLRATFYRWVQLWTEACSHGCPPELWSAPQVLAVGDLHLENFGTWRDTEGRLVWGVNDFDEACELPYTNDLVRLATSAWLTLQQDDTLLISPEKACSALLDGYGSRLRDPELAQPIVLAEAGEWTWLREIADSQIRDPQKFWDKLDEAPDCPGPSRRPERDSPNGGQRASAALAVDTVPARVRDAIKTVSLPGFHSLRWKTRQAGLGSLGRPRYVELSLWHGAKVAREAKALIPSAYFCAGPQHRQRVPASFLSTIVRTVFG